eukprot:Skav203257  [mRNA]  locus=scaffold1000:51033:72579:+ [translate_table: standard]
MRERQRRAALAFDGGVWTWRTRRDGDDCELPPHLERRHFARSMRAQEVLLEALSNRGLLPAALGHKASGDMQNTPLHAVVRNDHMGAQHAVQLLAKARADLEAQNEEGRTPLSQSIVEAADCAAGAALRAATEFSMEAGSTAQHVAEVSARAAGVAAGEVAAEAGNTAMKSAEIAAKAATKSAAASGLPPFQAVEPTATAAARSATRAALNGAHPYLIVAEITRQLNSQLVENLKEVHQNQPDRLAVGQLKDLFSQANIDIHEDWEKICSQYGSGAIPSRFDTLRQVFEEMGVDPKEKCRRLAATPHRIAFHSQEQLSFDSFFQAVEKSHGIFMEAFFARSAMPDPHAIRDVLPAGRVLNGLTGRIGYPDADFWMDCFPNALAALRGQTLSKFLFRGSPNKVVMDVMKNWLHYVGGNPDTAGHVMEKVGLGTAVHWPQQTCNFAAFGRKLRERSGMMMIQWKEGTGHAVAVVEGKIIDPQALARAAELENRLDFNQLNMSQFDVNQIKSIDFIECPECPASWETQNGRKVLDLVCDEQKIQQNLTKAAYKPDDPTQAAPQVYQGDLRGKIESERMWHKQLIECCDGVALVAVGAAFSFSLSSRKDLESCLERLQIAQDVQKNIKDIAAWQVELLQKKGHDLEDVLEKILLLATTCRAHTCTVLAMAERSKTSAVAGGVSSFVLLGACCVSLYTSVTTGKGGSLLYDLLRVAGAASGAYGTKLSMETLEECGRAIQHVQECEEAVETILRNLLQKFPPKLKHLQQRVETYVKASRQAGQGNLMPLAEFFNEIGSRAAGMGMLSVAVEGATSSFGVFGPIMVLAADLPGATASVQLVGGAAAAMSVLPVFAMSLADLGGQAILKAAGLGVDPNVGGLAASVSVGAAFGAWAGPAGAAGGALVGTGVWGVRNAVGYISQSFLAEYASVCLVNHSDHKINVRSYNGDSLVYWSGGDVAHLSPGEFKTLLAPRGTAQEHQMLLCVDDKPVFKAKELESPYAYVDGKVVPYLQVVKNGPTVVVLANRSKEELKIQVWSHDQGKGKQAWVPKDPVKLPPGRLAIAQGNSNENGQLKIGWGRKDLEPKESDAQFLTALDSIFRKAASDAMQMSDGCSVAGKAAASIAGRVMGQNAAVAGDDPEQAGEVAASAAQSAARQGTGKAGEKLAFMTPEHLAEAFSWASLGMAVVGPPGSSPNSSSRVLPFRQQKPPPMKLPESLRLARSKASSRQGQIKWQAAVAEAKGYRSQTCIEDVNNELYGGLYSQMIHGDSFEAWLRAAPK